MEKRKGDLNPTQEKPKSIKELSNDTNGKLNRLVDELSKYEDVVVLSTKRDKNNTVSTNRESLDTERIRLESELSNLVYLDDIRIEASCQIPSSAGQSPHDEDNREVVFIVSRTSTIPEFLV